MSKNHKVYDVYTWKWSGTGPGLKQAWFRSPTSISHNYKSFLNLRIFEIKSFYYNYYLLPAVGQNTFLLLEHRVRWVECSTFWCHDESAVLVACEGDWDLILCRTRYRSVDRHSKSRLATWLEVSFPRFRSAYTGRADKP